MKQVQVLSSPPPSNHIPLGKYPRASCKADLPLMDLFCFTRPALSEDSSGLESIIKFFYNFNKNIQFAF